ncbi:hypothetical protein [Streptomyces xanthophaeus]|uniref:hypothetical protein n=1 Tax=Streptomyces xanthophaeus TaxID=67385 RepID=UPI002648B7FD|nr:hypothetical protein [Streptomyces xanthophaeus]WKD36541.1 hypothetical protein KO717_34475 [Streptomyces xanthophaeus]
MTAHPPRTRWYVETYDDLAAVWSGVPETDRQTAVERLAHLNAQHPTWKDGTPVQRRIVLETTTYEDMSTDTHLARFPKSGFVLPCIGGQDFAAVPDRTPDGRPAIRFAVGSSDTGHAEAVVPLDLLEEVIAGQREIARQAGGQPKPERCSNPNCAGLCPACYVPAAARIAAEALRQAAQSTRDDFGLVTGGAGPAAIEGAGA